MKRCIVLYFVLHIAYCIEYVGRFGYYLHWGLLCIWWCGGLSLWIPEDRIVRTYIDTMV